MPESSFSFASSEDLEAVVDLLRECGLPHEDIHKHLSGLIVAKHDGRLIGTIALEAYNDVGLLRSLAVVSDQRNRGLGRALYWRIVADAQLRGVTTLYLLTTTASEYFSKLGFRVLDRSEVPPEIAATEEFSSLCPSNYSLSSQKPVRRRQVAPGTSSNRAGNQ